MKKLLKKKKRQSLSDSLTEAKDLLKDDKLLKKVERYLDGFGTEVKDSDTSVENPVESESGEKQKKQTMIEKQIGARYKSLSDSSGKEEARKYLNKMLTNNYVKKDFVDSLLEEEKQDDNQGGN